MNDMQLLVTVNLPATKVPVVLQRNGFASQQRAGQGLEHAQPLPLLSLPPLLPTPPPPSLACTPKLLVTMQLLAMKLCQVIEAYWVGFQVEGCHARHMGRCHGGTCLHCRSCVRSQASAENIHSRGMHCNTAPPAQPHTQTLPS